MSGVIVLPRGFTSQPQYSNSVNTGNSITQGLTGFWIPGADLLPVNHVTKNKSLSASNVALSTEPFGRAFNFSNGAIDTGEISNISGTNISIALRVKILSSSTLQVFGNHSSSSTGFLLYQNGLNISAYFSGVGVGSTPNLTIGKWTSVAFSFTGGKLLVSVDGVVTSTSQTISIIGNSLTLKLGSYNWAGTPLFTGGAGYFALWNRGLSDTEIRNFQSNPFAVIQAQPRRIFVVPAGGSINLVGSNAAQSNLSSTGSITQVNILAGANSSQANAGSTGAIILGSGIILVGANASQINSSGLGAIVVVGAVNLAGANCSQANASGSGAITQVLVLSPQSCLQGNLSSGGSITRVQTFAGASCIQINLCSTGAISSQDVYIQPQTQGIVWRSQAGGEC